MSPTKPAGSDPAGEAWSIMGSLVLDNERRRQVSDALGMSFGRSRALRRIAKQSMTMGELAAMLGTDPPYVTIIVDDLQSQGLVERQPHPTDRRAKLVLATAQGKAAAAEAEAILGAPPAALAALSPKDKAELLRLLRLISGASN